MLEEAKSFYRDINKEVRDGISILGILCEVLLLLAAGC
jgi:hypothetical protein